MVWTRWSFVFRIPLPPFGTLMRGLSTAFFLRLGRNLQEYGAEYYFEGDSFVVECDYEDLLDAFTVTFEKASEIMENKLNSKPGDIKLHRNDISSLKKNGVEVSSEYCCQFTVNFCKSMANDLTINDIKSTATVKTKGDKVYFGGGKIALFQMFGVEKYSSASRFMRSNLTNFSYRYYVNDVWLGILLSGFSFTYSGYFNQSIILLVPPEDFSYDVGIYDELTMSSLKTRGCDPMQSYVVLITISTLREYMRKRPEIFFDPTTTFNLTIYKISKQVNTFTLVSHVDQNFSQIFEFATRYLKYYSEKLGKDISESTQLEEALGKIVRLVSSGKGKADKYQRAALMLYDAIHKSYDVYDMIYFFGRELSQKACEQTRKKGYWLFRGDGGREFEAILYGLGVRDLFKAH